jgi:hypothetical protein
MPPRPTIDLMLGLTGCRLSFDDGPRTAVFAASNLEDAVHDVVLAAVDLIEGRTDTGFLWRVDLGGVFVDIHLGPYRATLVVHEMADPEWSFSTWYPERAHPVFKLSATPRRFMEDFASAVAGLPAQVAAGGKYPVWGRPLPVPLITRVTRYLEQGGFNDLHDVVGVGRES